METCAGENFHGLVKVEHFSNQTFADFRLHIAPGPPAQKNADKTFTKGGTTAKFAHPREFPAIRYCMQNCVVMNHEIKENLQGLFAQQGQISDRVG